MVPFLFLFHCLLVYPKVLYAAPSFLTCTTALFTTLPPLTGFRITAIQMTSSSTFLSILQSTACHKTVRSRQCNLAFPNASCGLQITSWSSTTTRRMLFWLHQAFLKRNPISLPSLLATISSKHPMLSAILDSSWTLTSRWTLTSSSRARRPSTTYPALLASKKHLKLAALNLLVHSFVMSQLDYGNSLLSGVSSGRMERLQSVQNCAAPLITCTRQCNSITPHLKSLHWPPIKLIIDFKVALLCYQCLNGCTPLYLSNLLQPYRPNGSVSLRFSSTQKLAVPSSRTKTYGDRAFSVYAEKLWNKLLSTICSSPLVSIFKNRLKTHVFVSHFEWKTL